MKVVFTGIREGYFPKIIERPGWDDSLLKTLRNETFEEFHLDFEAESDVERFVQAFHLTGLKYTLILRENLQIRYLNNLLRPPLLAEVQETIDRHGIGLEMDVALMLRKNGFRYDHSTYYIDPVTAKPRELDFLLRFNGHRDFSAMTDLIIPIECKDCRNSGWIGVKARSNLTAMVPGTLGELFAYRNSGGADLSILCGNAPYVDAVIPHNDKDSEDGTPIAAFKTLSHHIHARTMNARRGDAAHLVFFPILVTHAKLFLADKKLASPESISLVETDEMTVHWQYPLGGAYVQSILICHFSKLEQAIHRAMHEINLFPGHLVKK